MLLEALLSCVRSRTIWPLTLAIQSLRGNQSEKHSLATYAEETVRLPSMYERPNLHSIPMESPTLTLVDCPECDGEGWCFTLTSGAADVRLPTPLDKRLCGSCVGAGRVEPQKRIELLQRQVRLLASTEPATAEFIGGPLDGQMQQLSEPLPTFQWAHALPDEWDYCGEDCEEDCTDSMIQVDEYTYERQRYYSSHGNAVYLCMD